MPSELTPATLAELKRLKAEATPGPYEFCKGPYLANVRTRSTNRLCCEDYAAYQRPEDAAYDAALRNHAEALIAAAEERNHIEVLRLEACGAWADCIAERDELLGAQIINERNLRRYRTALREIAYYLEEVC